MPNCRCGDCERYAAPWNWNAFMAGIGLGWAIGMMLGGLMTAVLR